ncbi:hypothetical protein GX50_05217 [[Emmonsia] crescens]|uniref:Uncharacterized protein n=1 Tax=[Emmonsia] crescens TaxID=73230 RepID=A0A2B7ZFQ8_9EURO|nr:hypothetical protein GX50_05217 [Emmonsia crescens]
MSPPAYATSDGSASTSFVMTPGECQYLLPLFEEGKAILPFNIHDKFNDGLNPHWTTTIDCGCSVPHLQIRTKGSNPFNYVEVRILSFGPDAATPDPYANNARIETVCTISTLHTVGMHVGITKEMICADSSIPPFFRSSSGLGLGDEVVKKNMICAVQRIFKTLKPDLRLSSQQITIQHHPYIDILPFPTLRNNFITHQEEVDEDEFFQT